MDRDPLCQEVQLKNQQLTDQVHELERALSHTSVDNGVTIQEYQKLFEKNQKLQSDVLKLSEENIELRFDSEQAKKDLPRMKERINDLQKYNEALKMENAQLNGETARSMSSTSSIKRIGESGKSTRELEKTIALLKKVVERLQAENEQLKRSSGTTTIDQVTMYKVENEHLKAQLDELQHKMGATLTERYTSQQKGTAKLMADFEKMRQDLIKEKDTNEKLRIKVRNLEVHQGHQDKKLTDTQSKLEINEAKRGSSQNMDSQGWKSAVVTRMYEKKINALELDLEKKNKLLMDTKQLLKDSAEREENLIQQIDELKRKMQVVGRLPSGSGVHDLNLMEEFQEARLKIEMLENQKKELLGELRLRRQQGGGSNMHLDDDILTKAENYDKILADNIELRMTTKSLILEKNKLQAELKKMKKELEHFGPEFFEEVEDMKYNYKRSVEKNILYEEKLKQISRQFGISLNIPDLD
ncbi:centrosomal protein of 290 kDa-like [Gigantopelta aegis]|uniref:centrosomal protein of 290 kDa-like n=1 Tax=Gigantopelta aegis TaxID=1735272 RepID=UPI001B88C1D9|nr:centrosomal protein of 290 kDa-like [Gigantopelta aegis]XP_041354772.1 centrosomal protein of 290 kDa-like [Gigantopelta aegis]